MSTSDDLHRLDAEALVARIGAEDASMLAAVERARPALARLVAAASERFARGGRVVCLGAGTSGRLAVLDAAELGPTYHLDAARYIALIAGGPRAVVHASEGAEDDPAGAVAELDALHLDARDTVLGVSASGTTPYVRGALAHVAARPANARPLVALVSCAPLDTPAPELDHLVVADTGLEVVRGSTRMKAGTATKILLNAFSTALLILDGRVHGNLMVEVRGTNAKLARRATRIVATLTGLAPEAAESLLAAAGSSIKVACVMHHHGLARAAAEQRLAACAGRLDAALARP